MVATFHEAFVKARNFCHPAMWHLLSPAEQTRAIYREMRQLDLMDEPVRRPGGGMTKSTDAAKSPEPASTIVEFQPPTGSDHTDPA
jgi:hypothetical protein